MSNDLAELLDRPIAFHRCFVDLGAGIQGALILSQAIYWSNRTSDHDGWFWKTRQQWDDETGLRRRQQESARAKLCKLGILEEDKRGVPCRVFYRVNWTVLGDLLKNVQTRRYKVRQLDGAKRTNKKAQNVPTITETTAETTSETTTPIAVADAPAKGTPAKPKKQRPKNLHFEAFRAAYDARFSEPYGAGTKADFVQLARFVKEHPGVTPERFVAVARFQWGRGEFIPGASRTIKGLCAAWPTLANQADEANGGAAAGGLTPGQRMTAEINILVREGMKAEDAAAQVHAKYRSEEPF